MNIAVLVSGGVDSSVALRLLKDQGYSITAFYLKIWLEDELSFLGNCPWQEDLHYVEAVCKQINVPLEVISLQKEYWETVVAYTISQVKAGLTPNPDILCNQQIKFGSFYNKIGSDFDAIASGHYAQLFNNNGVKELFCAPDPIKDQTYFLSYLTQTQLQRALFPIGHLHKHEVRTLAQDYNLPNKARKDSQGICFLGKLKFDEFLKFHLGKQPGPLIEVETGKQWGIHNGFWYYTIGQRHSIGLAGGPWYVTEKDPTTNTIYISRAYYDPNKKRNQCIVGTFNWISGEKPHNHRLRVKLRHGQQTHSCHINFIEHDRAFVHLDTHDQGIAPGQFAVFYDENKCLGAGIIQ